MNFYERGQKQRKIATILILCYFLTVCSFLFFSQTFRYQYLIFNQKCSLYRFLSEIWDRDGAYFQQCEQECAKNSPIFLIYRCTLVYIQKKCNNSHICESIRELIFQRKMTRTLIARYVENHTKKTSVIFCLSFFFCLEGEK